MQIDMNQSENFRDKWFAKFTKLNHREIYPVYSNSLAVVFSQTHLSHLILEL